MREALAVEEQITVSADRNYSDEQIQALTEFQERFFTAIIVRNKSVNA
jgi:hypothetical protein